MTGLSNLLNSEDLLNAPLKTIEQSSDQDSTKGTITPTRTVSSNRHQQLPLMSESEKSILSKTSYRPLVRLRDRLPKSKVNKRYLPPKICQTSD